MKTNKYHRLALLTLACCLCAAAAGCTGRPVNALAAQQVTNNHTVEEAFHALDIRTVEADVVLLPTEEEVCRVVCCETEKITHTVTAEGGTLRIRRDDQRSAAEKLLASPPLSVTVYLPSADYENLAISTVSGRIEAGETLSFGQTDLGTTSGKIDLLAATSGGLTISTVSGAISLRRHTGGDVRVGSTSGAINAADVTAATAHFSSTSGRMELSDVVAEGELEAEAVSGALSLIRSDGGSLSLTSVSGSITASLRTPKIFRCETVSGRISAPSDTAGAGTCRAETVSGSITLTIADA